MGETTEHSLAWQAAPKMACVPWLGLSEQRPTFFIITIIIIFLCVCFHLYVYMCTMCMPDSHRGRRKTLDLLELGLQMVVKHHVDTENWTWVFCKDSWAVSPAPQILSYTPGVYYPWCGWKLSFQGHRRAGSIPESAPYLTFSSWGVAGNLRDSLTFHPRVWLPAHMTFFLCECLTLDKFPVFINTPVILDWGPSFWPQFEFGYPCKVPASKWGYTRRVGMQFRLQNYFLWWMFLLLCFFLLFLLLFPST